jgi:hypothetical protein
LERKWVLNSGLHVYKAGTLLLDSHLQSILLWLFWRWSFVNYLRRLASNYDLILASTGVNHWCPATEKPATVVELYGLVGARFSLFMASNSCLSSVSLRLRWGKEDGSESPGQGELFLGWFTREAGSPLLLGCTC